MSTFDGNLDKEITLEEIVANLKQYHKDKHIDWNTTLSKSYEEFGKAVNNIHKE